MSEVSTFKWASEASPFDPVFNGISTRIAALQKDGVMPVATGLCLPGRVVVSINSVEFLDEIFVKSNAYNTKANSE